MANYRKKKRSVITKCTTRSASKELFLLSMLFYFKLDSVILEEPEYNTTPAPFKITNAVLKN